MGEVQLQAGEQVGAYRLVRQLGSGGMGVVWLAEHELLGRRAAVKLLRPSYSDSTEVVQRFFNEARASAAIPDPGIVQIFDFGYHSDGSAYIVMELLDGETLDARLDRLGAMPVEAALVVMRQVASSLGSAHASHIIHRDLKPENIFIVRDPEVPGGERAKILDFGIAKLTADPGAAKTETSALIGTPMYMSPEQCRGARDVDPRTDVYSLGCVLFALIARRPPFLADNLGDLIAQHLSVEAPRLTGVQPEVERLLTRCLAKDPRARYANGSELAAAIGQLLGRPSQLPYASGGIPVAPVPRSATTLSTAVSWMVNEAPRRKRRPWLAIGASAAALAIGGVVAYSLLRPSPEAEPTEVAPAPPPAPAAAPAPVAPRVATIDPELDQTRHQLAGQLADFVRWAATHPSSPCPVHGELGRAVDAWGHPLAITCTDQPADQIVGVISRGPDGMLGTADDVTSWQLGPDVTAVVRGARWAPMHVAKAQPRPSAPPPPPKVAAQPAAKPAPAPAPVPVATAPAPAAAPPPPEPAKPSFRGTTLGTDGIPTRR